MLIKVCGMKYKENLREVALLKPDFLGFIFYSRSKRYMRKTLDEKTVNSISKKIKKTGVFVNAPLNYVAKTARLYKLDFIQLHGNESVDYCTKLRNKHQLIKAFGINDSFDFDTLKNYEACCDYFLFDTKTNKHGGSGKKFNWSNLKNKDISKPFFLSGGISLEDIPKIKKLRLKNLKGIDVNSRFELKPGLKNTNDLKKLIKLA